MEVDFYTVVITVEIILDLEIIKHCRIGLAHPRTESVISCDSPNYSGLAFVCCTSTGDLTIFTLTITILRIQNYRFIKNESKDQNITQYPF